MVFTERWFPEDAGRIRRAWAQTDSGIGRRRSARGHIGAGAELRRRLDDLSWKESPAVASSCLRSFQVVSNFASGAVRESLEAVRVADVGAAEGGD